MNYEQFFGNPTYQSIESQLILAKENGGDILGELVPRALKMTVITIADQFGGKYSRRSHSVRFGSTTSPDVIMLAARALGSFADSVCGDRICLNRQLKGVI